MKPKQKKRKAVAVDRERLLEYLATEQPELKLVNADQRELLRGRYRVNHDGEVLDRFEVEILIAPRRQDELPLVRETAGRIPRTPDRHMNDADGAACVTLPEAYFLASGGTFDLVNFLEGEVRSFFLAQALVERGDPWPHGEWAHGDSGRGEFFNEILGTSDTQRVKAYLRVLSHASPRGHWLCPCGSRRKLRDCCRDRIDDLRRSIPMGAAKLMRSLQESS